MNLDQIIAAINGLDQNQKAELSAKLSANAEKPRVLNSLRAAKAISANKQSIELMLAAARRLGVDHVIKMDSPIDPGELNRELRGKHIGDRMDLKNRLLNLGMLD
jgi:hypothetical protein